MTLDGAAQLLARINAMGRLRAKDPAAGAWHDVFASLDQLLRHIQDLELAGRSRAAEAGGGLDGLLAAADAAREAGAAEAAYDAFACLDWLLGAAPNASATKGAFDAAAAYVRAAAAGRDGRAEDVRDDVREALEAALNLFPHARKRARGVRLYATASELPATLGALAALARRTPAGGGLAAELRRALLHARGALGASEVPWPWDGEGLAGCMHLVAEPGESAEALARRLPIWTPLELRGLLGLVGRRDALAVLCEVFRRHEVRDVALEALWALDWPHEGHPLGPPELRLGLVVAAGGAARLLLGAARDGAALEGPDEEEAEALEVALRAWVPEGAW
jgi:hypothetical protein